MKKRPAPRRRVHTTKKRSSKKLHHKVISFFRGDGGIYVIFVLATVMAGAFALTGGVIPTLNPKPSAADQVTIDPDSAKRSSESALQLVDLKIKPSPTPTAPPQATPTRVACLNKIALNLILDVSTSMNNNDKINQLNLAMGSLVGQLKDETVVGATEFAGLASFPGSATKVLLSPTKFNTSTNKSLIKTSLTHLSVQTDSSNDGTYMRNAFQTALSNLKSAKNTYASQGYKFITILFTDGVPETQYTDHNCEGQEFPEPNYLCFSRAQDPRTDLTNSMKSTSNKVYSVGIYSGTRELQAYTQAIQLLSDIASSPTYATSTKSPTALTSLF